jgi:hypothetical protein
VTGLERITHEELVAAAGHRAGATICRRMGGIRQLYSIDECLVLVSKFKSFERITVSILDSGCLTQTSLLEPRRPPWSRLRLREPSGHGAIAIKR